MSPKSHPEKQRILYVLMAGESIHPPCGSGIAVCPTFSPTINTWKILYFTEWGFGGWQPLMGVLQGAQPPKLDNIVTNSVRIYKFYPAISLRAFMPSPFNIDKRVVVCFYNNFDIHLISTILGVITCANYLLWRSEYHFH